MAKNKKEFIIEMADLSRKEEPTLKDIVEKVTPKRRAVMTSDDDEEFINHYYEGRTDAFRFLLRRDKENRNWKKTD